MKEEYIKEERRSIRRGGREHMREDEGDGMYEGRREDSEGRYGVGL